MKKYYPVKEKNAFGTLYSKSGNPGWGQVQKKKE